MLALHAKPARVVAQIGDHLRELPLVEESGSRSLKKCTDMEGVYAYSDQAKEQADNKCHAY